MENAESDGSSAHCPECGDTVAITVDRSVAVFDSHWDTFAERCPASDQPIVQIRRVEYIENQSQARRRMTAYGNRNRILRSMGFRSYADYLASDLWRKIRRHVFARSNRCAGSCGRRAVQVHHGKYGKAELIGSDLTHLYPICDECHRRIEFCDGSVKLTPQQATEKLLLSPPPNRKHGRARKRRGRQNREYAKHQRQPETAKQTAARLARVAAHSADFEKTMANLHVTPTRKGRQVR